MNKRSIFWIIGIGLGLWWLFSWPAIHVLGVKTAIATARPFWAISATGTRIGGGLIGFFKSQKALNEENRRLRQELDVLQSAVLDRERLKQDNQALREIFNRRQPEEKITVGRLLTRPEQSPLGMVLVDVGQDNVSHSVAVDDLATSHGTVAIGRVAAVSAKTLKVELY